MIDFLLRRTPRERALLAALFVICLPLLLAFGVIMPLLDSARTAARQHDDAVALHGWVSERVTELGSYAQAPELIRNPPIGSSGLEQSLIEAGLRDQISDLGVGDAGAIELRFDLVTFTALADWISTNEASWGYDIATFRFEATDIDGKVSATLALTPQV